MNNRRFRSNNIEKLSFEYNWEEIFRICLGKARRWENIPRFLEAKDLAVIAAEKIWLAFDEYDGIRPLRAFVNTIAKNAIMDICRGNAVLESSLDETRLASSNADDKDDASESDADDDYSGCVPAYLEDSESTSLASSTAPLLGCLPSRQRMVIEMSYGLGDNYCEWPDDSIAQKLGITRQTVISDRKKALKGMYAFNERTCACAA